MRSHESAKPFKCNSCHLTFDDETSLLAHIPKHRETKHSKVHICNYCGKSYNQQLYLSKHMQAKHGDKIQNSKITSSIQQNLATAAAAAAAATTASINQSNSQTTTRSRSKQLNNQELTKSNEQQQQLNNNNSPSNSPTSSTSSSFKSNLSKSKKLRSSPILNCLPAIQNTSTPTNYSINNNNSSWNKSIGSSSPDSVNSSNCLANSDMINLNSNSIGQLNQTSDNMFNDLNSTIPTRYDNLQQSVDLFYSQHATSNPMNSVSNQHQSAFTALNRTNQNSPKYFTNSCDNSFVFNKPQYSSASANSTSQLHAGQQQPILTTNQQSANNSLSLGQHNSILQDNQILQTPTSNQTGHSLHQLSLNNHLPNHTTNSLLQSAQPNSVQQLQHLQHSQTALNQIRNYACMPNGNSTTAILQSQPNANTSSTFVNNIFLNAQNNPNSIQSMSVSNCNVNDYPIMILQ